MFQWPLCLLCIPPFLLLSSYTTAFNIDVNLSLALQGSDQAYFGMSFALYEERIFVGAPGDENGLGSVLSCEFPSFSSQAENSVNCHPINSDALPKFEASNLGASMKRIGSSTFVCAPLLKRERFHSIQANMGTCFEAERSGLVPFFTLKSSTSRLWKSRNFDGWRTASIMGTGLSSTSFGELVIGLPLARSQDFSWDTERVTGSMGVVGDFGRKNFMLPKTESVPWSKPNHATEDNPGGRDLTGISIDRGQFFIGSKDDYVVGAPKSNKLRGRVYICKGCFDVTTSRIKDIDRDKLILEGEQIGSRFGQAVIAIDLDGNSYDDIVVGAPLYSHDENNYDSGQVYIYRTGGSFFSHQFEKMTSIVLQRNIVSNGQFGAAIGNLGDIDGDGFQDFVVGAPFEEEGVGAVYLYRGNPDFQIKDFSQKITPTSLNLLTMAGFGYSFSNTADVDGNGTPDFAVGAIHSDLAVIIRTKKVARIFPKSAFKGDKLIEPSSNAFTLSLCAILDQKAVTSYKINILILPIDERIEDTVRSPKFLLIRPSQTEACGYINVSSAVPNFGVDEETMTEIPKPLKLRANLNWEIHEEDVNPMSETILSPESRKNELNVAYNVELKSVCHNRACHCQLESWSTSIIDYVVGESPTLNLGFNLENKGSEPAFNIIISLEADAPELQLTEGMSRQCQVMTSKLNEFECNLGLLKPGTNQDYTISFDVASPKKYIRNDFQFQLRIHPACSIDPVPKQRSIDVQVIYEYDIHLSHHVEEPDLDYEENSVRSFSQVFMIQNTGPSPLEGNMIFEIGVPVSPLLDNRKTELKFDNTHITCLPKRIGSIHVPENDEFVIIEGSKRVACDTEDVCLKYFCHLHSGAPPGTQNLFLGLLFDIDSSKRDHTESYQIIAFLSVPALEKSSIASTNFDSLHRAQIKYLYEFVLPLVGGLILGVILLIIVFCILWKTGAFSKMRIYKNKLKEMEEETAMFVGSPYPRSST